MSTKFDFDRIMSGFHGAFATGVASQQGTLTLPDTWFRPPFWDLLMLQLLRPNSSNLPCLYSTFHLEYPLVLSRFCFQWKLQVQQTHIELSFLKNVFKTRSVPFSSYIVMAIRCKVIFILIKSIVPCTESLIITQCVLFCPYVKQ